MILVVYHVPNDRGDDDPEVQEWNVEPSRSYMEDKCRVFKALHYSVQEVSDVATSDPGVCADSGTGVEHVCGGGTE